MCGIAGIVDLKRRPVDRSLLERMCGSLRHRGPDEEGCFVNCFAALGQRRLSIIDLAGGHQPMSNEDGSVWVSFNGEIYNFQILRRELIERGHRFATNSDTEVIVHAYEEYGPECVQKFRGMFALAVWDQRQETLFLARDRVGKKPLFYTQAGGRFLFASELQALVVDPAVSRDVDATAIDDYLTYGYIPAPKTAFSGIHKLPPAHWLTLSSGPDGFTVRTQRYWRLSYAPKLEMDEQEASEALLEQLTEAVRLRLIADVPLGVMLSGGVDSGIVTALMSRLSDKPVKTFAIGFDDPTYDELPDARRVAQQYATEHHELIVRPKALDVLPMLVRHYGEPYADSSAIPTYYVAQLTSQHVKAVLNGDGGDESFAGYQRYLGGRLAELYQRIPQLARRGFLEPVTAMLPDGLLPRQRMGQAKRFMKAAGCSLPQRYLHWVSYFRSSDKDPLYTPQFREQLDGHDSGAWLNGLFEEAARQGDEPLDSMLSVDVESYLPYDLLVKMDIATMANSLEARSPFLDHHVMEFCARLPRRFKQRGLSKKYLLKRIGEKLLPAGHVHRPKRGFAVPVGAWMRGELRDEVREQLLAPAPGFMRMFSRRQCAVCWSVINRDRTT